MMYKEANKEKNALVGRIILILSTAFFRNQDGKKLFLMDALKANPLYRIKDFYEASLIE